MFTKRSFGLVILFVLFCSSGFGMVYPIGDMAVKPTTSFDSGNGYVITQGFLATRVMDGVEKTHLGVDLATYNNASGGDVYAIDAGIVADVQYSQATTGWGTMVRIRHQLPDGTVYYSQSAHLLYGSVTVSKDSTVVIGQVIGQVGSTGYSTNPHLDFEVKRLDNDGCGYLPDSDCSNDSVDNYYDPLDFIEAHNQPSTVARYSNGALNQPILDCFNRNGGADHFGQPFNNNGGGVYVHDWYSLDGSNFVTIQDFYHPGYDFYSAIIESSAMSAAFELKAGFRWYYMDQLAGYGPSTLNAPLCDERAFVDSNGLFGPANQIYVRQDFQTGKTLIWNLATGIQMVDTPSDGFHIALGGQESIDIWTSSVSYNQVILNWLLPFAGSSVVYRNDWPIHTTTDQLLTDNTALSNTTYRYYVQATSSDNGVVMRSPVLEVTTPANPNRYTITAQLRSGDYDTVDVEIVENTLYPYAPFHCFVRNDGAESYKVAATSWSFSGLQTGVSHTFYCEALTASDLVLGRSNVVTVFVPVPPTVSPTPTWTPRPDPNVPFKIVDGMHLTVIGDIFRVSFTAEAYQTVTLDRFSAKGYIQDPWGDQYSRSWPAVQFSPPLVMNPGDR